MKNIVIEASCKNSMKADFEKNRITAVGQSFRAALFLMAVFLMLPVQSFASTKVFEREYTYSASEADSKLTCRVIALEQVKRLLLEELGTYLQSISEVKDGILTKDEIVTLTAGVVRTEIISEHWDGKVYRLKATIKADPDYVIEAINRLRKDRQKSKDLKESQVRAKQYLNEIERLKQDLAKAKGEPLKRKQIEYGQAVKDLSAEDWFEKGFSLANSKRYEEAIMAYTKALDINPRHAKAYNNRGNAWAKKGNYNRAIADYNKALEINPRLTETYYNRGCNWADKGNYDRAITDYDSALEINPRYAGAYYNRGAAWADKGNYDRAIADFNRALEINPRYAGAYYNRGVAWAKKGNYDRAIADFNSALEINPRDAEAYSNKGLAWAMKGDLWQALADARKGLRLNPKSKWCQKVVDLLKAEMRDKK
jgi:tetratricopeptide (TPR) repeat protein